jgi:hypothetical protein
MMLERWDTEERNASHSGARLPTLAATSASGASTTGPKPKATVSPILASKSGDRFRKARYVWGEREFKLLNLLNNAGTKDAKTPNRGKEHGAKKSRFSAWLVLN